MALDLRGLCLELNALESAISVEIGTEVQVLAIDGQSTYRDLTSDEQNEWNSIWKNPNNRAALWLEESERVLAAVDEKNLTPEERRTFLKTKKSNANALVELQRIARRNN